MSADSQRRSESDGAKLFRIVMLGQGGAGKSNVADRFARNMYTDPHKVTLGVEFQTKLLVLSDGSRCKFEIWDTSGQERYAQLAPMYYRGAHAAIVVYDITDKRSFNRAKEWVTELQQNALSDMVIVLVGNKLDIAMYRRVDSLDAEVYCDDNYLLFAEVSAKTSEGIHEMFETLARRLLNDAAMMAPINQESRMSGPISRTSRNPPVVPMEPSPSDVIKLRQRSHSNGSSNGSGSSQKGCSCGSVVVTMND